MSSKPEFGTSKKKRTSQLIREKKEEKAKLLDEPQNEKIKAIYDDVMEAQEIMADNIDKMTANLKQAEGIEEKTNAMVDKANTFKKQSKALKKNMCWRKWTLKIMIGGICACICLIIVLAIVLPLVC